MTYLEQYREAIRAGEIIAGQELIQELDKLITDLDNPKYYYDTTEAYIRIEFIETFCLQSKSPFYGQPLKLMLWEKAFIEIIYSFYFTESKRQRFKKIILLIARKNGKSTLCAALAFAELIIGNSGSDIVCSSNDDNQANIIYLEINTMREMFDTHNKRTWKNQQCIKNLKNRSKVFKLSDRTRNKEGRNIDFGILDESHEMKDNTIGKSIEQSQSLKINPKFINISTEGFVNDGYLDNELIYARKVLNDEIEDDTLLPFLYTQDSEQEVFQDHKSHQKSNPSLYEVKQPSYIEEQLNKARYNKADRMFTLAKDFNIKQNNAQAWLMKEDYTYKAVFNIEEFRNAVCLGAVDLSETTDLTCAKVLLMKPGDKTKYVYTKYFIPESKIENNSDKDAGANYLEWAQANLIEATEGNDNDLTKVADWFYSLYKEYGITLLKCGYDQRFANDFLNRMEDYGFECEMVLQNRNVLSNPMKLVEADLKSQILNYNENPIDNWCFGNASVSMDNLGQFMAVKINNQKERRIDGAVTTIILYEMFRRYRNEFLESVR